eukprot:1769215-Prorocentrum_lima.AAC.1
MGVPPTARTSQTDLEHVRPAPSWPFVQECQATVQEDAPDVCSLPSVIAGSRASDEEVIEAGQD